MAKMAKRKAATMRRTPPAFIDPPGRYEVVARRNGRAMLIGYTPHRSRPGHASAGQAGGRTAVLSRRGAAGQAVTMQMARPKPPPYPKPPRPPPEPPRPQPGVSMR
jgi:hypothetical protein